MLGCEKMSKFNKQYSYIGDVPDSLNEGDIVVALGYNRQPIGEPFKVDEEFAEEYNPLHAYHPHGQPSVMKVHY